MNRTKLSALLAFLPFLVHGVHIDKRATCTVASNGDISKSDVPALDTAIASCGAGGVIVLSAGKTYALNAVWDISACKSCEIQIEGTLKLNNDFAYWEGKTGAVYAKGMTGATIHSTTKQGIIDGNGQHFWEVFSGNSSYRRPTMVYMSSISNVVFQDLYIKNTPAGFHSVSGSNVKYINNTLYAVSTNSSVVAHNTDGYDTGSTNNILIQNSMVTNDDDCVAFKPGSNYVTVDGLTCVGSQGVSVGSLGSGAGSTDIVQNIYVHNITMINSTKALGIKLYQGGSAHGVATVKNVTYDTVTVTNCDYAVQIQSCYGSASTADCTANPSQSSVTDFYVKHVTGKTSGKTITSLDCPAAGTCDVYLQDFNVQANGSPAAYLCSNVDNSDLGVTCTGAASG